ncbi:MAG: RHS repeat-associated core domain-containing protein [Anaerolineaceae bacterium]
MSGRITSDTRDANGNMTHEGGVPRFAYNPEGKLTTREGYAYSYDGDGKRVMELNPGGKTTIWVGNYYEQSNQQSSNTFNETIYADGVRIGMRKNNQTNYWFHLDHLGGTHLITMSEGQFNSRDLYKAWGEERYSQGNTDTRYHYTGQMKEDDNLYYYNARWYDPAIGRFMQADTIVPSQQGTQGWDRYAYVNNNPIKYVDPGGNYACDTDGNCFVDSWESSYTTDPVWNQPQENTCWAFATALGIQLVTGDSITPDDYSSRFSIQRTKRLGGIFEMGLGVPLAILQWSKYPRNYSLDRQIYTREKLISNIKSDFPTVMQIPLRAGKEWGHDVLAVGLQGDSFLFFSWGNVYNEEKLLYEINKGGGYSFESFDAMMSNLDSALLPNSMMRIMPRPTGYVLHGLSVGGSWINQNYYEVR